MKIMFFDEQNKREFTDEMKDAVRSVVEEAIKTETSDGALNILLTDDDGIKALNAEFRNKDSATDVLSFPAYSFDGLLKDNSENIEWEYDGGERFLGDVAISLERAYEQAEQYGHSAVRECAFLALHGALHIMGYDHIEKDGELIMIERQNQILEKLGIRRGII